MPPPVATSDTRRAIGGMLFLAAVGEAYQAYSSINSSPQTTELFAAEREQTLMKYVNIGAASALVWATIGSLIARSLWPIVGGVLVVAQMHYLYRHARDAGKYHGGYA